VSSRSIDELNKYTHGCAVVHKQLCAEQGIELLIYCTKRENAEQDALYAIGRTLLGKIVTNARAGESAHNPDDEGYAAAYDCCPTIHGKPIWDAKHPAWAIVGKCGEEAGLVWSGRWTGKLRESAHFQDPSWRKK
jgi:peptidoglycan L-alanyl-D-glutamate endopeptidase CwlK